MARKRFIKRPLPLSLLHQMPDANFEVSKPGPKQHKRVIVPNIRLQGNTENGVVIIDMFQPNGDSALCNCLTFKAEEAYAIGDWFIQEARKINPSLGAGGVRGPSTEKPGPDGAKIWMPGGPQ
jgi:hypothetical protein